MLDRILGKKEIDIITLKNTYGSKKYRNERNP